MIVRLINHISDLLKYIKVSAQENAEMLSQHPFLRKTKINTTLDTTTKRIYSIIKQMRFTFVEVAGVEPASKQGTRKLSTRLAAI